MKDQKRPTLKNLEVIYLSYGGLGFFPFAPGTVGTLGAIPFLYLFGLFQISVYYVLPILIINIVLSSFLANLSQNKFGVKDPSWIVIDEVLGMATAWLFWPTAALLDLFFLFLFFRLFDIIKIWPATYFDKRMKHGAGVILDDIVSGIFAGLIFFIVKYFLLGAQLPPLYKSLDLF